MKMLVIINASCLLAGFTALGADAGVDAGADAGTGCAFGESECGSTPWMWCNGEGEWVVTDCTGSEEAPLAYSPCNCAPEDPCGWAGDTICDEGCLAVTDSMFDDSTDCAPVLDAGADSDSDADTDTDADADTDTGADAAVDPAGDDDSGCSCASAGRSPSTTTLLELLI